MIRSWSSSIFTVLLALALSLMLPACGDDSEDGHSHGGDSHTHEQAAGQEHGDHARNGDHAHEDTAQTRLDPSGMDADSTSAGDGGGQEGEHSHEGDGHSHAGEEHSHR